MFEKFGRAAEELAARVSVSRRGFLGRLGRCAVAAAGAASALLTLPREAQGGSGKRLVVPGPAGPPNTLPRGAQGGSGKKVLFACTYYDRFSDVPCGTVYQCGRCNQKLANQGKCVLASQVAVGTC
jgi:hypothetical protein